MSVTIAIPFEIEQRLRERAAAEGQALDAFVLQAVEEKLASPVAHQQNSDPQKKAAFDEWMRTVANLADRYPPGYVADDSRESMYEGRGE